MNATILTQHLDASREIVYQALVDPKAIAKWMFPDDMNIEIHEFESKIGGRFRISLTYKDPSRIGKTSGQTDTYNGTFIDLVPNEQVVETLEFETADPKMQGEMIITFKLSEADEGTLLQIEHKNLPQALSESDNELGWRISLNRLKAIVEKT